MNESTATNKTPLSVVISAKNEEKNMARCLAHLSWADEIFVVDSQSMDRTAAISKDMGAKVVQFYLEGSFPKKKNWALKNLPFSYEWVLIVDADEVIPSELAEEISQVLQNPSGYDGYFINRCFYFLGRWLRHGGYYPSYNLRLFKHRLGRYEKIIADGAGDNEVHEHVILNGRAASLKHEMLHYAYPDLTTWMEKHNRYAAWEADLLEWLRSGEQERNEPLLAGALRFKRRLKRLSLRLPLRFLFRFFYMYIWKGGFLDGRPGFIFCVLQSFYDFLSWAKAYEKRMNPPFGEAKP